MPPHATYVISFWVAIQETLDHLPQPWIYELYNIDSRADLAACIVSIDDQVDLDVIYFQLPYRENNIHEYKWRKRIQPASIPNDHGGTFLAAELDWFACISKH